MSSHKPITVVLARFDDLLAGGLRELIESDANLEIVASDVQHSRIPVVLRGHRPDVAVLDVSQLGDLAEVGELGRRHPDTRLVLLTGDISAAECAHVLALGASAYLGRDTQARDLLNAIHLASRGMQLMPRALSGRSSGSVEGAQLLTPREGEVLPLLQNGRSNAQIALALHVGVETVRTHTRNIYRKLGVSSRRELTSKTGRDWTNDPEQPAKLTARAQSVGKQVGRRGRGAIPLISRR
jgi:DNA-binding NarL/FixJ family response regulator